jgi:hypothetical protein
MLEQLMEEIRPGQRRGSLVSTLTTASELDKREFWRQLERELDDVGMVVTVEIPSTASGSDAKQASL